jgi:hypothetical protein
VGIYGGYVGPGDKILGLQFLSFNTLKILPHYYSVSNVASEKYDVI